LSDVLKELEENSLRWATLLADPEYHKLDWFDIALRQLGGIVKTAKLIRVSASQLQHFREHGWNSLNSDQMMDIARASGVPLLGLMVQCNRELDGRKPKRAA
jgi:hypothetical protein